MFRRKLQALKYETPDEFNYTDDRQFREFIVWLENQKIRLYRIEDREALDDTENLNWPTALNKYLNDLNCPVSPSNRVLLVEWLLSTAVRFEYSDNAEKYSSFRNRSNVMEAKSTSQDPLENLDFNSPDFKAGVSKLMDLFNMPKKPDDTRTNFLAVSKLLCEKLSPEAIQNAINNPNPKEKLTPLSLDEISLGFDTGDPVVNEAAKILRLLHIKELRNVQTRVNETIVALQLVTANPKTDSNLGKVGF